MSDFLDNYITFHNTQLIVGKKRIAWIDISRGIGILLVVYGHALSPGIIRYLIYAFHMPLFFFLSGLVFRYKPDESWQSFIGKNARNILLPYLIFAILSLLLWYVTRRPELPAVLLQFGSIFYGNGNNNLLAFNNLLWFLPCLFLTRVLFFAVTRYSSDIKYLLVVMGLFACLGYCYSLFFSEIKLPFGLETALTAIVFFGGGYLMTTIPENIMTMIKKHAVFFLITALIIFVVGAMVNIAFYELQVDLRQDRLNNVVYFYLGAWGGIISTVLLSMIIKKNRLLEYLGKQSLVIFAWHLLAFPYVSKLLTLLQLKPLLSAAPQFISPIIYSLLAILIVLVLAYPIQWKLRAKT